MKYRLIGTAIKFGGRLHKEGAEVELPEEIANQIRRHLMPVTPPPVQAQAIPERCQTCDNFKLEEWPCQWFGDEGECVLGLTNPEGSAEEAPQAEGTEGPAEEMPPETDATGSPEETPQETDATGAIEEPSQETGSVAGEESPGSSEEKAAPKKAAPQKSRKRR